MIQHGAPFALRRIVWGLAVGRRSRPSAAPDRSDIGPHRRRSQSARPKPLHLAYRKLSRPLHHDEKNVLKTLRQSRNGQRPKRTRRGRRPMRTMVQSRVQPARSRSRPRIERQTSPRRCPTQAPAVLRAREELVQGLPRRRAVAAEVVAEEVIPRLDQGTAEEKAGGYRRRSLYRSQPSLRSIPR